MFKLKTGDYEYHKKELKYGQFLLRFYAALFGVGSFIVFGWGGVNIYMIIAFYLMIFFSVTVVFTTLLKHKKIIMDMDGNRKINSKQF